MRIVVIGSGVAGTHAALTLLERGHAVELWDVGVVDAVPPAPDATFHGLKAALPEPETYFLGRNLEAMVPPGASELLRYPPSRRFLARSDDPLWPFVERGFAAHASFATGGLANGWGANALAFDDDDMAGWPVSFADMAPAYRVAFNRVPVAGPPEDALSPYFPGVRASQAPVRTSRADDILLARSTSRTRALARRGVHIGRARLAVVTDPLRPDACTYCDRCLWGCPRGSIYNPATSTLAACAAYPGFRHLRGRHVVSLITNADRVTGLRFLDLAGDTVRDEACDAVFLAAGALQSGAIFLRTLKQAHPDLPPESEALMDTAVVKIPYVLLRALGQPADERAFQFNRLILGLVGSSADWPRYLHGEVLHLTGLIYHPLIEHMPFDSRTASRLFFAMKSALGVVSLFFPDKPSPGNRQVLEAGAAAGIRCVSSTPKRRRNRPTSRAPWPEYARPCGRWAACPGRQSRPRAEPESTTPAPSPWARARGAAAQTAAAIGTPTCSSPTARPSRRCPASRSRCRSQHTQSASPTARHSERAR